MPLKVLVIGAGVAGPALAFWLARGLPSCSITVVERAPALRDSGQQIDLRGAGMQIMRAMGLEPAVRRCLVRERGTRIVDGSGRTRATFPVGGLSTDVEIMRGDLVGVLYNATRGLPGVRYAFGTSVESLEEVPVRKQLLDQQQQDQRQQQAGGNDAGHNGVLSSPSNPRGVSGTQVNGLGPLRARFSDGTEEVFDVVVGADGQTSRTRRMMLLGADAWRAAGSAGDPAFHPLGMYMAYFTLPSQEGDTNMATICHCLGGRMMATRQDRPDLLRVYLCANGTRPALEDTIRSGDAAAQKRVWAALFRDAGWQAERFVDGMLRDSAADDFYTAVVGNVRMRGVWTRGRVALVGDAGYGSSPVSGSGTSAALLGAYVLAGEIARACGPGCGGAERRGKGDEDSSTAPPHPENCIPQALAAYNCRLRPYIHNQGNPSYFFPSSSWELWRYHASISVMSAAQSVLPPRSESPVPESPSPGYEEPWNLPEYPELKRLGGPRA